MSLRLNLLSTEWIWMLFAFLLSRDDASELQARACCTVNFLPKGEAFGGIWSDCTKPAKPCLRVSVTAERMLMKYFQYFYLICFLNMFFFSLIKVLRIHPHPWVSAPNANTKTVFTHIVVFLFVTATRQFMSSCRRSWTKQINKTTELLPSWGWEQQKSLYTIL